MIVYNKLLRLIASPYMYLKNKNQLKNYKNSIDSINIRKYKNMHNGKRCFIIGNGPSLNYEDLNKLNNEITFASNRIKEIYDKTDWRCDYYVVYDREFLKSELPYILSSVSKKEKFINICAKKYAKNMDIKNVNWINCMHKFNINLHETKNITFSSKIDEFIADSWTVTYTILQIAIYMGFKDIYLLGIDNYAPGNKHFYQDKKTKKRDKTYVDGINYGYNLVKKYALEHNINIYNVTRGGNLKVFERINFDDIL